MRSDRLLRGMHQVCSHDLPNQLVALQSLLEMLHLEESSRLSPDGQEYVRRLKSATQRTADLARFLKEMERLVRVVGKPEEIAVATLGRELQGVLCQAFPAKQLTFDWQWSAPTFLGDYRTIMQALTEVLTWCVKRQGSECRIQGRSTGALKVTLQLKLQSLNENRGPRPTTDLMPDQRMEMILAREYLAVSQATLEYLRLPDGSDQFTMVLPNP